MRARLAALVREMAGVFAPAIQLVVRRGGEVVVHEAAGWLDPETRRRPVDGATRFDLASLTKLFVVTALMRLVERGRVSLAQPVHTVLPAFSGPRPIRPYEDPLRPGEVIPPAGEGTADADAVTFRHLITHTAGLPAWRPLYRQPDADAARRMALETFFAAPVGRQVIYSDIGLILLGMALEALTGRRLDEVVRAEVTGPLGLTETAYHPLPLSASPVNVAPTEFCAWRGRRVVGEVHDENAYRLGGVAGHAGLFSTAAEVAAFGQLFLDGGGALLRPETVAAMTRPQTAELPGRPVRGLGFHLCDGIEAAGCRPFGPRAFGHTGFTGTSLWVDPDRDLVVALLTNEVYNGRQRRRIAALRLRVHQAVVAEV